MAVSPSHAPRHVIIITIRAAAGEGGGNVHGKRTLRLHGERPDDQRLLVVAEGRLEAEHLAPALEMHLQPWHGISNLWAIYVLCSA